MSNYRRLEGQHCAMPVCPIKDIRSCSRYTDEQRGHFWGANAAAGMLDRLASALGTPNRAMTPSPVKFRTPPMLSVVSPLVKTGGENFARSGRDSRLPRLSLHVGCGSLSTDLSGFTDWPLPLRLKMTEGC